MKTEGTYIPIQCVSEDSCSTARYTYLFLWYVLFIVSLPLSSMLFVMFMMQLSFAISWSFFHIVLIHIRSIFLHIYMFIHSFIHSVFFLTTGPKPPPKRCLHIVRSRASSFKWEYHLLSLRSYSSFLRLLPRLLATSIFPFIFPSITCFRRHFLRCDQSS